MIDQWVLRALEDEINTVEQDRDTILKEIEYHQEQLDWRRRAVETATERLAALRTHIEHHTAHAAEDQ